MKNIRIRNALIFAVFSALSSVWWLHFRGYSFYEGLLMIISNFFLTFILALIVNYFISSKGDQ